LTPDKRQLFGKICLEELDRAQQIINDYLSLARPYPEVIEKLDMCEEIKYVSTVLTSYSNLKGVELRVETEENLYISGDRHKLRQCIINIAKNGIEAMEQGGILEIKVKKQNNEVILIIRDSGAGMTTEQINRLGTPYFSTKEKGTGLGTMVSFNIIKNMMGKIKIESKVGEGTSFQISFPAEAKTKSNTPA
jgi:two-component system sporulation sensor kinase B